MIRRKLSAVLPIRLVSVVFGGIVGGGNVDTGYTIQISNGKRQNRGRTHLGEQIYTDSVRRKYLCRAFGKFFRIIATVVADGDAALLATGSFQNKTCKTFSCMGNGKQIHTGSARAHNGTKARRAKGHIAVETALYLILTTDGEQFRFCSFIHCWIVQPAVVIILIVEHSMYPF